MTTLANRLAAVRRRIGDAERAAGRAEGSVSLVAVSKLQPVDAIREMAGLGVRAFGENYLIEALEKQEKLAGLDLEWHFIGHLQSNKTRQATAHFDWVHGVDSVKVARRLGSQRPAGRAPINVCLQVNADLEPTKSGVAFDELDDLVDAVDGLAGIRLRGLMTLPAPASQGGNPRQAFARLRKCLEDQNSRGHSLDVLSMGMTDDLEDAIAEGATHVRIGTALFGPRPD